MGIKMEKGMTKDYKDFSLRVFLSIGSFFSTLYFVGIRVFIVGYERNVKSQFSAKQGILATRPRNWNELWV